MAYWWVSQNRTGEEEQQGNYLWAPKKNKNNKTFYHWTNVAQVRRGDSIFCYMEKEIRAIAIAEVDPYDYENPFKSAGAQNAWEKEGWRVDVAYDFLDPPIEIKPIAQTLINLLPERYSPLTKKGTGVQGYLFELTPSAAEFLLSKIGHTRAGKQVPEISQRPVVTNDIENLWRTLRTPPGRKKKFPTPAPVRKSKQAKIIGDRAEKIVLDHLKESLIKDQAETLEWVAKKGLMPGWDIQYVVNNRLIAVEVKGTTAKSFPNIDITANEWEAAREKGKDYWLYLVTSCKDKGGRPHILPVQNPYGLFIQERIRADTSMWRLSLLPSSNQR